MAELHDGTDIPDPISIKSDIDLMKLLEICEGEEALVYRSTSKTRRLLFLPNLGDPCRCSGGLDESRLVTGFHFSVGRPYSGLCFCSHCKRRYFSILSEIPRSCIHAREGGASSWPYRPHNVSGTRFRLLAWRSVRCPEVSQGPARIGHVTRIC